MSRIGKKPILLNKGIKISRTGNSFEVSGPKGKLAVAVEGDIDVAISDSEITVSRKNELKKNKALHGLYRSLLQNMITGVTEGFSKKLELVGIGYRAEMKGKSLVLQLGYSHSIVFNAPEGVNLEVSGTNNIVISGIDKQLVGLIAAKIRTFRPPEPYKGKGIKYENEVIRRKAGKTAAK
ncbi:MAG TPA: 50S ribosomal protein L6 [Ignavibacteria bacterium]|jgi:large subunit ribosomal protein L6